MAGKFSMIMGGIFLGASLISAVPLNVQTEAVREKRAGIERQLEELGTTETVFRGERGSRRTYAVVENELVKVAQENPNMRYNDEGMPTRERLRSPFFPISTIIWGGAAALNLTLGIKSAIENE